MLGMVEFALYYSNRTLKYGSQLTVLPCLLRFTRAMYYCYTKLALPKNEPAIL
uniref:Uncharacterized protein n=1 Tax=Siphoviridae sp. ctnPP24 TaxID=2825662 RepID=A0A8S5TZ07_9CAUD|nr:MAG TPA: hypothetical protein [Siphoviridae sp. ctnPP24]